MISFYIRESLLIKKFKPDLNNKVISVPLLLFDWPLSSELSLYVIYLFIFCSVFLNVWWGKSLIFFSMPSNFSRYLFPDQNLKEENSQWQNIFGGVSIFRKSRVMSRSFIVWYIMDLLHN